MDDVDYSQVLTDIFEQYRLPPSDKYNIPQTGPFEVEVLKMRSAKYLGYYVVEVSNYVDKQFQSNWDVTFAYIDSSSIIEHLKKYGIRVESCSRVSIAYSEDWNEAEDRVEDAYEFGFNLLSPELILPEPETEGGYESWMM